MPIFMLLKSNFLYTYHSRNTLELGKKVGQNNFACCPFSYSLKIKISRWI